MYFMRHTCVSDDDVANVNPSAESTIDPGNQYESTTL